MSTENLDTDLEITLDDIEKLGGKKPEADGELKVDAAKPEEAGDKDKPLTGEEGKEDLAKQLEAMKATAEAERKAREDADRRASEAAKQADDARKEVGTREEQLLKNALDTLKDQRQNAKSAYKAALEAGDYEAVANAQERMSDLAARLTHVEQAAAAFEARKTAAPKASHEGRVEKPADQFEQAISNLSPSSQAWARRNPTCFTEPKTYAKTLAAHHSALAEDIQPDTPQYFEFIEERLGLREAPKPQETTTAAPVRTAPRPAAPVSRSGNGPSSRLVGNTVTLTPAERQAAKDSGLTEKEYAANLLALEREGRLGVYHQR